MCWHVCNNCNDISCMKNGVDGDPRPRPCIWFIPGVDESGLKGCPYDIPEEDNELIDPACWIAVPFSKILELMEKYPDCYKEDSDKRLDREEQEYNEKEIERLIG